MTWYVVIPPLNGRVGFVDLAEDLLNKGFEDRVEYFSGGWIDNMVTAVYPHLKFENEDDAIAYVLACGGTVTTKLPIRLDNPYNHMS